MALFTDATEILDNGNNKQVKKIEDSNGNIIWGSQSAFPYRRLEYLNFNGTDNYIASPFGTKSGYYREITMTLGEYASDDMRPFFVYDGNATNAARRWGFLLGTSQGFRVSVGSQWSASGAYPLSTYWPLNTKRTVGLRTYTSDTNRPVIFWTLDNEVGIRLATGQVTSNATDTITKQAPYIMAGSTTGSSPEKYVNGRLYGVVERRTNESGTLLHNYVPAQRKSDGVCGIYDTVGGEFRVMNGSGVTTAAGPIVNEYWELTDTDITVTKIVSNQLQPYYNWTNGTYISTFNLDYDTNNEVVVTGQNYGSSSYYSPQYYSANNSLRCYGTAVNSGAPNKMTITVPAGKIIKTISITYDTSGSTNVRAWINYGGNVVAITSEELKAVYSVRSNSIQIYAADKDTGNPIAANVQIRIISITYGDE